MSNYKFGLAVANSFTLADGSTGQLVSPDDSDWWAGFIPYLNDRYDTPSLEKEASRKRLLPMFLHWEGEHIFHYSHKERVNKRDGFFRRILPKEHPLHQIRSTQELSDLEDENNQLQNTYQRVVVKHFMMEEKLASADISASDRTTLHERLGTLKTQQEDLLSKLEEYRKIDFYRPDPFSAYGGDYWMHELYKNVAFWEGLHKAGTRGVFVLEVGSEHSISFDGFKYALYNQASCPAWFLIVADLRGETWTLEKVYPRVTDFKEVKDDEEYGQDLHFYSKYENQMIEEALSNPHRETLTADILHRPSEPWFVY